MFGKKVELPLVDDKPNLYLARPPSHSADRGQMQHLLIRQALEVHAPHFITRITRVSINSIREIWDCVGVPRPSQNARYHLFSVNPVRSFFVRVCLNSPHRRALLNPTKTNT